MNLEGILSISGKPGLFKLISQAKNKIIVESLIGGQRIPIHSHMQVNMLEEIGIYTYEDTKPIAEIFDSIAKKENGNKTISHKSSTNDLTNYFRKILSDYDEERVYVSDIKKIIQWYNTLQSSNLIKVPKKEKEKEKEKEKKKDKTAKKDK